MNIFRSALQVHIECLMYSAYANNVHKKERQEDIVYREHYNFMVNWFHFILLFLFLSNLFVSPLTLHIENGLCENRWFPRTKPIQNFKLNPKKCIIS